MKKIYSLAAGLIVCGSIVAQSAYAPAVSTKQRGHLPANMKPPVSTYSSPSRTLGPKYWVEPVGAVMNSFGVDLMGGSTAPAQDNFLDIVYMDSTATLSDPSGTSFISTIMLGSVLDPKSPNLDPTGGFTPILTGSEAYSIDSLQIIGSYVKVNAAVTDTLYTWLVWGDTASTSVFSKRTTTSIWVAPINTWRPYIIAPKVTGATGAAGNKVKASAPASNRMLIKYVLTAADEATGPGFSNVISIALPTIANIPAGNIASAFYTFVPGTPTNVGDCSYSFTGAPDAQTVNGFAGMIWNQSAPTVAAVTDYQNQQVDPDGYNMGTQYNANQRHAVYPASYINSLWGDLVTAPLIFYSIYSNSSVGINEASNNFTVGQNVPNPFTNQTKINYQLKTAAKSVTVEVYDIAGAKMFDKTESNLSAGSYSVDINTADYAAGMYFYSINVDGVKVTKKMVNNK